MTLFDVWCVLFGIFFGYVKDPLLGHTCLSFRLVIMLKTVTDILRLTTLELRMSIERPVGHGFHVSAMCFRRFWVGFWHEIVPGASNGHPTSPWPAGG